MSENKKEESLASITSLSELVRVNAINLFSRHDMAHMRDKLGEFFDTYGGRLESLVSIIKDYGNEFDWLIPKFKDIIMKIYRQYESYLGKKND